MNNSLDKYVRLRWALDELNKRVRAGVEFPDAASAVAFAYHVDYDALRKAYDFQFEANGRM